jgi:hypothetical protein
MQSPTADRTGHLYLLHLDRPLSRACNQFGPPKSAHYLGFARNVSKRISAHAAGTSGSKYMRAAYLEGVAFDLVRTWPDATRTLERRLKNRKCLGRLCPVCIAAPSAAA